MRKSTEILVEDLKKEAPSKRMQRLIHKAEQDYFHDFFGVPTYNFSVLLEELKWARASTEIQQNVVDGKYDATKEEADEWAKSTEGQEIFEELRRDIQKGKNS